MRTPDSLGSGPSRPHFSRHRTNLARLWAVLLVVCGIRLSGVAAGLSVGSNINITQLTNHQTETAIAINTLNPLNLFVAVNGGFNYLNKSALPCVYYYSTNAGASWRPSDVSALPLSCCDPSCAWDGFGNLFLTYLAQTTATVVALSTNGSRSFQLLYETTDASDQPTITTGAGGNYAPGSVWITYENAVSGYLVAQGAAVNGLGLVGSFGTAESVGGAGGYGDIVVGANGEVLVAYQVNLGSPGPDTIYLNLDPDGLGPAGFNATIAATVTQVGGHLAIPPQPHRTIDAEAGLAWDMSGGPFNGRVYLVYTDRASTNTADTDIFLRYSDDMGSTWSAALRVNDDPVGNGKSQFLSRIALDQTTGNLAVSFYDSRDSTNNLTAEYWATASVDGGASFLPNLKVSAGMSSANVNAVNIYKFDYGDYSGLAYYQGVFYPCWGDNSNSTGNNPDGTLTTMEAYVAAVLVPPVLALTSTGTEVTLSWPNPSTGFILQESAGFDTGVWTTNATTPAVVGNRKQVTLTPTGTTFYRLFHP